MDLMRLYLLMDRLVQERLTLWKGIGMMKQELMKELVNLSFKKTKIME